MISQQIINEGLSYEEYIKLVEGLVAGNKTTGNNQEQMLVDFTKLNLHRMERISKQMEVQPKLVDRIAALKNQLIWIVIAEAWCGDCAQNVPALAKLADASKGNITLRIIGKDQHPEVMEAYLTNGAQAIPKLICLNTSTLEQIDTWGPRPVPAQEIMLYYKANKEEQSWEDFEKKLHGWYAKDKSITLQEEFIELIPQWDK